MKPLVSIFTDGACSPNPGGGGWAAVLVYAAKPALGRELAAKRLEAVDR